jgi:chromosome segregation ATPase
MNQPTRDEHEELKERVKKLEEQHTEPIQITVERKYPDRDLLQNLSRSQDEHAKLLIAHSRGINTLQTSIDHLTTEMNGARADIMSIKATQSDHGELLREHGQALAEIKEEIAEIKEEIAEIKEEIAEIKATMATLATKEEIAEIKATQDKILQLLQK